MSQVAMKLPTMFDHNHSYTYDNNGKHITTKTLSKLDLQPKDQGHSRNQDNGLVNKNMPLPETFDNLFDANTEADSQSLPYGRGRLSK